MSVLTIRSHSIFTLLILGLFPFAALTVAQNVKQDGQFTTSDHVTTPPLRQIVPLKEKEGHRDKPIRLLTRGTKSTTATDSALQLAPAAVTAIGSLTSFDGLGVGGGYTPNAAPPDTNGAVGANQFVQWVNESFAVYDKTTGARLYGPAAGNTLFQALGATHPCAVHNDGDPIAQYDKAAGRWVMTQFSVTSGSSQGYWQCVAVSQTSDATGAYNVYAFNYGTVQFNDYPKLGVWPNAYYITFNIFNNGSTFAGSKLCAYDRTAMLAGTAANQVCFQTSSAFGGLLPADLDGTTPPPAGSPAYFVAYDVNSLLLWKMSNVNFVAQTATLTGPITVPVAAFSAACNGGGTCIPQTGTIQKLDSLADRLMYRLAYRNFGDHESIVVNHSVTAGSSVGVRWYELRDPNGTPTVYQQGTYAPDSSYRWMGSAAMDKVGNLAVGYSVSSSSLFPSIRFAGRAPGDPLGTLGSEVFIKDGLGSQNGGLNRWGDYSSLSVDPVDDCTMWYTTEYLQTNGSFNWSTRIGYFKFSTCGAPPPPPPAAPTNLMATAGSSSQINLAWTDNSNNEDGFKIERCQNTGCSSFAQVAQVGANITSYSDTGLTASTTYGYRVRATNLGGDSAYSNTAEATTQVAPALPVAPSNLAASAVSSSQINLSWTDNSSNESGFKIERCRGASCTGFTQVATVGANVSIYSDTGLSSKKTYRYRVRASNATGDSAYSNTASARTF